MQEGADGERDAPEEVLPPEAEDADDGEVRGEAVDGSPHDDLAPVLPPGGRRQPRPGERGPDSPRGAVELPVRLGELGRRHGGVLGAVDGGRRRRGGRFRGARRGAAPPGLRGEVGVAADVEAVGLAEAVEAEERERGAEDEQVEEEDHQPEHVPALAPRPRRRPSRTRRRGPRHPRRRPRRRGARVPAHVAGGGCGGGGHGAPIGDWGDCRKWGCACHAGEE